MLKDIINPKKIKTFEENVLSLAYSIGYYEARLESTIDPDIQAWCKYKLEELEENLEKAIEYYEKFKK